MRVTFWGTRGSLPAPMNAAGFRNKIKNLFLHARPEDLASECAVDAYLDRSIPSDAMTFGGNTPCVEITEGDQRIILDCGSGLRELGHRIMEESHNSPGRIDILQTHTHWDHIMGFPFFAPALHDCSEIHVHGVHPGLRQRFEAQMDRIHFPVTLDDLGSPVEFHRLNELRELFLGPFHIRNKGLHHPGGSYAYRVSIGDKSVVFATDGEYHDRTDNGFAPYVEFYREADLLIFDAMYSTLEQTIVKADYGHSTAVIGVELALRAGVKTLALFHHDPESDDAEIADSCRRALEYHMIRKSEFPDSDLRIVSSYDGMIFEI
jgi:phosphoribosyl 1,2-cyclic phosphodiesterase